MYPPREGDLPLEQIKATMDMILAQGGQAWIKWTCPKCGERVVSDEEGCIHLDGYLHTEKADGSECGGVYEGKLFGLLVALPLYTKPDEASRSGGPYT